MAWYWWIAIILVLMVLTLMFMRGVTRNNATADESARRYFEGRKNNE